MPIDVPRGMRDFGPGDAIRLKSIIAKVEETFKRFGFYPIETPSMENLDTLNAKAYGQEADKEIYSLDGGTTGMIYDLTVPLARFVSMNRSLNMPFKRYQISRVWRRDEPQKMRSREFVQADIDIVGSKEPASEAEVISATALCLEELGVESYDILLSSRVMLNAILDTFKIPEAKHFPVIIIIDKLGKMARQDAVQQMAALGLDQKQAESLLGFISEDLSNEEKLQKLETSAPAAKEEVARMRVLLKLLSHYNLNGNLRIDLSLARGLGYYTGPIWEFVCYDGKKRLPTLASGGRYDGLIGIFSKQSIPAVGSSIGIYRVFEAVNPDGVQQTYATAYVANIGEENADYAISIANRLRAAGIYADMNLTTRNISKQLEYANSLGIRYVVIAGSRERQENKARLRDMSNGNEEALDIESIMDRIKS